MLPHETRADVDRRQAETIASLRAELEAMKAELATALDDAKHAEESQTAIEKRGREYYDRMLTAESRAAQLEAENGRLREALKDIGNWSQELQDRMIADGDCLGQWRGCIAIARAALTGREG